MTEQVQQTNKHSLILLRLTTHKQTKNPSPRMALMVT